MNGPNQPVISVIIVNFNGRKWLDACLGSLRQLVHPRHEVIVVDNGSTDESVSYIKANFPGVKIMALGENRGFAGGNNAGIREARGEYVFLLNNDTRVAPDCLTELIKAALQLPAVAAIQPKLVRMDDPSRLDSCGSYWTSSTLLWHEGYDQPVDQPDLVRPRPYFSLKGAAMLLPRRLLQKLGAFDEDFWCYYEETDLCHRLWLAGFECWYYPTGVVEHARGGTTVGFANAGIQYHNFKNKLCSFLKNFQVRTLVRTLPVFGLVILGLSLYWLVRGRFGHVAALMRALGWNVRHLPGTLRKRRVVQATRRRTDREIFATTKCNPRLRYYWRLLREVG